jgi:alkylation response protein AidB-like acyl-CoA dehydrogenase
MSATIESSPNGSSALTEPGPGGASRAIDPRTAEFTALLTKIAEGASEREANGTSPHEQIAWLKEAGVTKLRLPIEDGGAGLTLPEFFQALIDLAEADSNVAHILRVHFWFIEQQLTTDDSDARARGIALVNSGAVVGNGFSEQSSRPVGLYFDTSFTADGDGYRLSGQKFYSTGTAYGTHTQIWAAAPDNRIAGAVIPLDREGVKLEDDWDGFGQRLTATGTTKLENVRVEADEFFDLGEPDGEQPPSYHGPFLQLYLQAVTAGILKAARNDAVALVKRRKRNFSHSGAPQHPSEDRQVLQVIGEIDADAFAAEAIVLHAARVMQEAFDSIEDGAPAADKAEAAQRAAAEAKIAIDRFSYAAAAHLFDVGGASATQSVYNLDRHWRNVRTISTHNPTFLKASAVGDHIVSGAAFPANAYF